jgi:hypothetical protein
MTIIQRFLPSESHVPFLGVTMQLIRTTKEKERRNRIKEQYAVAENAERFLTTPPMAAQNLIDD